MSAEMNKKEWGVLDATVQGASHIRTGMPNQDYIGKKVYEGIGLPIMLAVADGHGSPTYFRSDIGAQLAVEVALEEMEEVFRAIPFPTPNIATIKELMKQLPVSIVEKWHERVRAHSDQAGLTPNELQRLRKDPKLLEGFMRAVTKNPSLPYGATLLATLVTQSFIFYFQIGDGDIQIVTEDGSITRAVKDDSRLLANETTSLCSTSKERALRDFRTRFDEVDVLQRNKMHPALILLSTDGYSNSFSTPADFSKVGRDVLHIINQDGVEKVHNDLPSWLNAASEAGSGDDISLGLIWHRQSIGHAVTALASRASLGASSNTTSQGAQSSAPSTSRQSRVDDAFLIDSTISTGQSPPSVLNLLAASHEGPPRERWAAEQYTPPPRPLPAASQQRNDVSLTNKAHPPLQMQNATEPKLLVPGAQKAAAYIAPEEGVSPSQVPQEQNGSDQSDQPPEHTVAKPAEPLAKEVPRHQLIVRQNPAEGEYDSIAKALQDAHDDTWIQVYPGIYPDMLSIDKNICITCPEKEVVVEGNVPCLQLSAAKALIFDVCFRGKSYIAENKDIAAIEIDTGKSTLIGCDITSTSSICVRVRGIGANPTLEKCVIQNGAGVGVMFTESAQGLLMQCSIKDQQGTGIRISESTPTIRKCTISNNNKYGIAISKKSVGLIEDCFISGQGPANIVIGQDSTPIISRCTICEGRGSGILVVAHGGGTIGDCTIQNNQEPGIWLRESSTLHIRHCFFTGGKSSGILVDSQSRSKIEECEFKELGNSSIMVLNKGETEIYGCKVEGGKNIGIEVDLQGKGIVKNCQIDQNEKPAVKVSNDSDITMQNVHVIHQGKGASAVFLTAKSRGIFEHCIVRVSECVGVEANDHTVLSLTDCQIYSEAMFALTATKNSNVTVKECTLQTSRASNSIIRDRSSHIEQRIKAD